MELELLIPPIERGKIGPNLYTTAPLLLSSTGLIHNLKVLGSHIRMSVQFPTTLLPKQLPENAAENSPNTWGRPGWDSWLWASALDITAIWGMTRQMEDLAVFLPLSLCLPNN